jgi:S1-C subfamily serine protease
VPIWGETKQGNQVSGTGFFYTIKFKDTPEKTIPLLITNYHVIKDVVKGIFEFVERKEGKPTKQKIRVEFDNRLILRNREEDIDLIAFPIASTLNQLRKDGKEIFYISISEDIMPTKDQIDNLAAIEDITFIGYPSGIYDSFNVSPLVRKGITSTPIWNNFKNEEAFLIDAGVYPGSSGSPVFIYSEGSYSTNNGVIIGNRVYFVGVLTESFISHSDKVFLGLGKVINSQAVKRYINKFIPSDI